MSGSLGTKAESLVLGATSSRSPRVIPRCRPQTTDWRSRTALATATGERDLRPNYTLDDKGKGKVSFVQKNGTTCEAPAEARWDGAKLVIEEKANPKCADGRTYARNTVNCEVGADGVAKCNGSQPGDTRSYHVQIGR